MGQKVNSLLLVVVVVSIGNIIGVVSFPLALFLTSILAVLIHYREEATIIWKTLPRDVKAILALRSIYTKLREYEKKDWTVSDLLREQVKKNPKKVCIYYEDEEWTYEDIENFSNKIANIFQAAGYKKGDVVALLMSNCPEYACIWIGLTKIGVITALINNNLRNDSLLHCIKTALSKAIIFGDQYLEEMEEIRDRLDDITMYQYPNQKESTILRTKNMHDLLKEAPTSPPAVKDKIGYHDRAIYIYTSGTTGMPKAAIIVQFRLMYMSLLCQILNLKSDDIVYNPLPLYHTAGGIMGITGPLCQGHGVVLKKKFSASAYWPDCIKYNCTAAQYIGEMCRYIQVVPPRPVDTAHKVKLMFGNGLRPNFMEVFKERFKVETIIELYGSTEGNANIVNLDKKVGAVGFLPKIIPASALPMAVIKVNECGEPIRGEDGLCIRCKPHEPGMFIGMILKNDATREYQGYAGDVKENQKKIVENVFKKGDRAFLSGDILVMDDLGYLYFKDRTGDTFRWRGENVSTLEVEETIGAVVGLKEVTVYGVEVGNLEGRAGMATIVDPKGEIDLVNLHSELKRRLPPYAQPLFIRLTNEPSMTGTFKLRKVDLQKEGFNPSHINDRLYFNNGSTYIELTKDVYERIMNGEYRI